MKTLIEQAEQCILKFGGLFAELELPDDEYLLVTFSLHKGLLSFKGDFEKSTFFSGEVITIDNGFDIDLNSPDLVDYSIDDIFELASHEIEEGYICPNVLFID